MTTPNSLNSSNPAAAPPATSIPASPPALTPLQALAAEYDVQDNPAPYPQTAAPAAPAAPAQPVPVAVPPQGAPAPSQPQAPAAPPRIPTWLMEKAQANGVPPIVIERLDALELAQVVHDAEVSRLRNQQTATTQNAVHQQNPQGQTPDAAAAAAIAPIVNAPQDQRPSFEWGEFDDYDHLGQPTGKKVKYTDEMLNPALAHHIKRQAAEIAELKGMIGGIVKQATTAQERRFEQEFDAAFSQWPQLFGKGSAQEVTAAQNGQQLFERRKLIFGAVKGMFKAMPPEVASRMTIRDGVASMVKTMFGLDAPAAAAASGQPQAPEPQPDFANGHVARPTQRQPNPKPLGRERAVAAVTEWWRENSANGTPTEGATSPDEFPD